MGKFCSNCGAALEEGARFCARCGKPAAGGEAAAGQTIAAGNDLTKAFAGERLKVLLFCVFLGMFGSHCFYTGRKGRGLIELLLTVSIIAFLITLAVFTMDSYRAYEASQAFGDNFFNKLLIAAGLVYAGLLVLLAMDLIKIIKGTFNKVESTLPKLTKKHLLFLGALLGLQIISLLLRGTPLRVIDFLIIPLVSLCGVFFGPIPGTIIAGLFTLVGSAIGFAQSLFALLLGFGYPNINFIFLFSNVLRTCVITAVTAVLVSGYLKLCTPESKLNRKLPDVAGKPVLQGVLTGAAYFAIAGICSFIGWLALRGGGPFGWLQGFYRPFFYITLCAAIAGLIGAALPPLLAKKGLYLGPFVTRGQAAGGQESSGAEGTV